MFYQIELVLVYILSDGIMMGGHFAVLFYYDANIGNCCFIILLRV